MHTDAQKHAHAQALPRQAEPHACGGGQGAAQDLAQTHTWAHMHVCRPLTSRIACAWRRPRCCTRPSCSSWPLRMRSGSRRRKRSTRWVRLLPATHVCVHGLVNAHARSPLAARSTYGCSQHLHIHGAGCPWLLLTCFWLFAYHDCLLYTPQPLLFCHPRLLPAMNLVLALSLSAPPHCSLTAIA